VNDVYIGPRRATFESQNYSEHQEEKYDDDDIKCPYSWIL